MVEACDDYFLRHAGRSGDPRTGEGFTSTESRHVKEVVSSARGRRRFARNFVGLCGRQFFRLLYGTGDGALMGVAIFAQRARVSSAFMVLRRCLLLGWWRSDYPVWAR